MQPDFLQQIANSPRRPKPRNKIVLGRFTRKVHVVSQLLPGAVDRPFEHHRGRSFAGVTSSQHQLLAFEQVSQGRGIQFGHADIAGERQRRVR